MRIVNRTTFLALPAETVFSKYSPCVFDALCIKGETLECGDFCYQRIADSIVFRDEEQHADDLESAEVCGTELAMDFDCMSRDGCFDEEQLFAVWSCEDVQYLVNRLRRC